MEEFIVEHPYIIHPEFQPGRRIIAVSDIHGNLPFFNALMEKIHLTKEDYLVLVGDLFEKGPESLAFYRQLRAMEKEYPNLYILSGNCDDLVSRFYLTDALDNTFYRSYLPRHPETILRQMAREGGFDQVEDFPKLRRDLNAAYPEVRDWIHNLPTILETEHLLFVHGGIPSREGMEYLDRWKCMKNDNFLGQGCSFDKWVIVGHWPVTLYDPHIPGAAPLMKYDRKIASIDGGCVLKWDGQLNALMLPSEESSDFTWTAYDGLDTYVALDDQEEGPEDPINIRWGRAFLERLEDGDEVSLCRHLESGRVLPILNHYIFDSPKGLWCEDSTDYRLPIKAGDRVHVVANTQRHGALCKKNGVTGWYFGRLRPL